MIDRSTVVKLFSQMRSAYGYQWGLESADIDVWLRRLGGFSESQILDAADRAPAQYRDRPPNLGQFEELVAGPPKRATTYRPNGSEKSEAELKANGVLLGVVGRLGGVDREQLRLMVDLKNALIEEAGDGRPPKSWLENIDQQLYELGGNFNQQARTAETFQARRQFCIKRGIRIPDPEDATAL